MEEEAAEKCRVEYRMLVRSLPRDSPPCFLMHAMHFLIGTSLAVKTLPLWWARS